MNAGSSVAYRPDIDGLRAVAVLSVIGYHALPGLVPGGYVGVDVFFVISGFLISSIIIRDLDQGRFSITDFYARRIRRIFPALIVVLAGTWLIGWFFLLPHEFRALGKHITASAVYFINFTLKKEAGYFDVAAEEKPLLHLWSLGVEEQFYIVWPLLLLLIRERRHLVVAFAVITLASFAASLEALGRNPASAFYLPQNRAWELASGALLALATLRAGDERSGGWPRARVMTRVFASNAMSCAGLALVLAAVCTFDNKVPYPGWRAMLPTLGAVLMIAAGPVALVNRHLLSWRGAVAVGLISYPLYLWHWPLLSFASILGLGADWRISTAAVAIAGALAVATYLLVERPLRGAHRRPVPLALLGATLAFALVGLLLQTSMLVPRLDAPRYRDIGDATADWRFPQGLERAHTPSGLRIYKSAGGGEKVLYIGDSHIEQYWPRIERVLHEQHVGKSVTFATTGGCPPIPGVHHEKQANCLNFAERAIELARQPEIGTIVLGAAWAVYLNNSTYYLEGEEGGRLIVGSPAWNKALSALSRTIADLVAQGKSVWVLLNTPVSGDLAPANAMHRSLSGATSFLPLQMDRAQFEHSWAPVKARLTAVATASGGRLIDPVEWICGRTTCPGRMADGTLMYMDGSHLRAAYVREHAVFMDATLGPAAGPVTGSLRVAPGNVAAGTSEQPVVVPAAGFEPATP